jgi:HK97 family phage major capsid protein
MTITELIANIEAERQQATRARDAATAEIKEILARAAREHRKNLSLEEDRRVKELFAVRDARKTDLSGIQAKLEEAKAIQAEEAELQRQYQTTTPTRAGHPGASESDQAPFVRRADGRRAALERGQRFADHQVVSEYAAARSRAEQAVIGQHGSLGNQLRSMTTTSGSAVVPTLWAADIIDRARNLSAVFQAGAQLVPMDAKVVQIGRLTTDPTAAFRTEGSTVTASDPVFDNVTLTATTLSALVVGSLEWFMDAPNVDEVVSEAIAKAVATELDLNALMGGVVAGGEVGATGYNRTFPIPPAPRGVLATLLAVAASSVLGSGANGTAQTATSFWREVQQTLFTPQSFNETPNALLWNSKLYQQYIDSYDTTNQPLRMPENIAALRKIVTNQIESFTQGTMTNVATDLFVGDWTQLLIGQRLDFTVQTLVERYAELGQVGIIAHWRGDVQLARPRAFAVYRYLQGAA